MAKIITGKSSTPPVGKSTLNPTTNKYEVDGVELMRVTDYIKTFCKEFDPMGAAIGKYTSGKNNGDKNNLSVTQRLHYWNLLKDRAKYYGSATHIFSEMYELNPDETFPTTGKEKAVKKYIDDTKNDYSTIGIECRVFSKLYKLGGTMDKLVQNKITKKYKIIDYKTSSDIDKYNSKFAKEPFKKYPQSKRLQYEMQLRIYELLGSVELNTGTILNLKDDVFDTPEIIILNNDGSYNIEPCDNLPKELVNAALIERADPLDIIFYSK